MYTKRISFIKLFWFLMSVALMLLILSLREAGNFYFSDDQIFCSWISTWNHHSAHNPLFRSRLSTHTHTHTHVSPPHVAARKPLAVWTRWHSSNWHYVEQAGDYSPIKSLNSSRHTPQGTRSCHFVWNKSTKIFTQRFKNNQVAS